MVCLGNIYVDEALAISKIHPERKANSLGDEEIENFIKLLIWL